MRSDALQALLEHASPRLPHSARRGRGVIALKAQAEEVFVGDVVEYSLPEGGKTVGLVEEISDDYLQIIPLVRREGVGEECESARKLADRRLARPLHASVARHRLSASCHNKSWSSCQIASTRQLLAGRCLVVWLCTNWLCTN